MNVLKFICPRCLQELEAPAYMAGHYIDCPSCRRQIQIPLTMTIPAAIPRSTIASRLTAGLIGGFFVAGYASNILVMLVGDMYAEKQSKAVDALSFIALIVIWTAIANGALKAHRAAKVWRRILIACGGLSFALPLAGFVMLAHKAAELQSRPLSYDALMFGDTLQTIVIVLCVAGLFLGLVFLTIGLLIGRAPHNTE